MQFWFVPVSNCVVQIIQQIKKCINNDDNEDDNNNDTDKTWSDLILNMISVSIRHIDEWQRPFAKRNIRTKKKAVLKHYLL